VIIATESNDLAAAIVTASEAGVSPHYIIGAISPAACDLRPASRRAAIGVLLRAAEWQNRWPL